MGRPLLTSLSQGEEQELEPVSTEPLALKRVIGDVPNDPETMRYE